VPWMAVDDQMHSHRKFAKLGADRLAASGLWVTAGSWASAHLTDGFVPDYIVMSWDPTLDMARALVRVGLWVEDKTDEDEGYRFHDWAGSNKTREQVEAARADGAERKRRSRERARQANGTFGPPDDDGPGGGVTFGSRVTDENVTRDDDVTDAGVTGESHRPLPSPPLPIPTTTENTSSSAPRSTPHVRYSPEFAAFWEACPRKVGKEAAAKAFTKALKRSDLDAATMTRRMEVYARYWQAARTEERFIVHPSRWLNEGRYSDPPPSLAPARRGPDRTVNGGLGEGTTAERVSAVLALKRGGSTTEGRTG